MKMPRTNDQEHEGKGFRFEGWAKLLLIACALVAVWSTSTLADVNRRVSEGYAVINMNTPAAWSYLKKVQHNPIVAAITGGLAPCDGSMSIVHSDRGDREYLLFTFTSAVTGNGVTYVVADVDKFLAAIEKATESRETVKPGVVCHEGVDMADGSRSNYILRMLDDGALTMELERNGIGILYGLAESDVNGLLNLAGER